MSLCKDRQEAYEQRLYDAEFSPAVKDYSKRAWVTTRSFSTGSFNGSLDRVMESVSNGREIIANGHVFVEGCKARWRPRHQVSGDLKQIPALEVSEQS
jgi:hypothetical protein